MSLHEMSSSSSSSDDSSATETNAVASLLQKFGRSRNFFERNDDGACARIVECTKADIITKHQDIKYSKEIYNEFDFFDDVLDAWKPTPFSYMHV